MHASLAMDGRRTVPEDRQDSQGLGGPTEPRAAGINKAALFSAASLVAASLPLITVVVLQNVELNCGSVGFTLSWLGIACTTAAISLGIIGIAPRVRTFVLCQPLRWYSASSSSWLSWRLPCSRSHFARRPPAGGRCEHGPSFPGSAPQEVVNGRAGRRSLKRPD